MNITESQAYIKKKCIESGLPIIPVKLMNEEERHYSLGLFSPYVITIHPKTTKIILDHEFSEYILSLYFSSAEAKEKMLE